MDSMKTTKRTTSGTVKSGESFLGDMVLGTDGVNDPVVTVYDGTDNTGTELIPTATYDSSALGLNGVVFQYARHCEVGIYVEITCGGTVEVVVGWRPWTLLGVSSWEKTHQQASRR